MSYRMALGRAAQPLSRVPSFVGVPLLASLLTPLPRSMEKISTSALSPMDFVRPASRKYMADTRDMPPQSRIMVSCDDVLGGREAAAVVTRYTAGWPCFRRGNE